MLEHPLQLNITQSELTPRVADYFDNLLAQRDAILARYHLTPETAEEFCNLRSTDEDREKILALYEQIVYVIEHKQFPPGEKCVNVFVVPDAINPYSGAFKKAGLPDDHPLCLEKKEMTLDIPEIIAFQTKYYRSQGRESWADDIEQYMDQLYERLSSPEEQYRIELRIKSGYIPVVMPGRHTQSVDWDDALHQLKPVYYKNGVPRNIKDPHVNQNEFLQKMTDPAVDSYDSFFYEVPERPYLMWTKPLAKYNDEIDPEWQTIHLAVKDQIAKLETLHKHYPALCDKQDITPLEYVALQSLHTETIRHVMDELNINIKSIIPLDAVDEWTRFVASGQLFGGGMLGAYFNSGSFRLGFDVVGVLAHGKFGFRPVARS